MKGSGRYVLSKTTFSNLYKISKAILLFCRKMESKKSLPAVIPIQHRWFYLIQSGKKTVEGKKRSLKWTGIRAHDEIIFECADCNKSAHQNDVPCRKRLVAQVLEVRDYITLRGYLEYEGLRQTLPGVTATEEGIQIYESSPISWTREEVSKYGIMAIEFKLV